MKSRTVKTKKRNPADATKETRESRLERIHGMDLRTRTPESKKRYNRKDKSWKSDDEN